MSDSEQLYSLKHTEDHKWDAYLESSYPFINDSNRGDYTSNQIMFDGQTLAGKWIVWRDAYLRMDLSVSSSGSAYTNSIVDPANPLAMKQSVLSLIHGLQVTTTGGSSLVNDSSIQFINNLRLLVENSADWERSEGAEIQFAKDTTDTIYTREYGEMKDTIALVGDVKSVDQKKPVVAAVTTEGSVAPGKYANKGLQKRVKFFYTAAGSTTPNAGAPITAGAFKVTCIIPLRYLHPFFDALDFPTINTNFNINFIYNYTTYKPLITAIGHSGTVTVAPSAPTVTGTRLYYHQVKLSPKDADYMASRLASGFEKTIHYRVTDYHQSVISGTDLSTNFSSSCVLPQRVWVLLFPTGTVNSYIHVGAPTNRIEQSNIHVNNEQYFKRDITGAYEQWMELKKQFPGYGSTNTAGALLNYQDFVTLYRLHCYDVSRLKERLVSPTSPVSLQLTGTASQGSNEAVIVTERAKSCTINMSANQTNFVVL